MLTIGYISSSLLLFYNTIVCVLFALTLIRLKQSKAYSDDAGQLDTKQLQINFVVYCGY